MEKVLVTGATGFIGLHCLSQLLDAGYSVRGTVRDLARSDEVRAAMEKAGSPVAQLEVVAADLLSDHGWDDAVKGCQYVLHVASPFVVGVPKDENELIVPAVEGTTRVVEAAIREGVKRVVLTSSCAAITETGKAGQTQFSEDDWTDASHPATPAYYKSKVLAERKAWSLIGAQDKTQLSVINPAGVVGPMLSRDIGTSNAFVGQIIEGQLPGCPKMHLGFVDVRDVASAHLLAMTNDAAAGERFIISEREFWFREITAALRESGFEKAPSRELPTWLVKALGLFSGELKQIGQMAGKEKFTPSDKAKALLGWAPRDVTLSFAETAEQLKKERLI